jgi:uncharacterized membrane protein
MKLVATVLAIGLTLAAVPAGASPTFEYIFDGGFALSVSDDGSVVAGNLANGTFGPFRWTQATGLVPLGGVTYGGGAGMAATSADGTVIAATIGSVDSVHNTQGRWTQATGWQELMPPLPPDGGSVDDDYGSVWGLSGDGTTVVGLYWRAGIGNRAHASKWTQATGVVDLGGTTTGQASRANGVNHDGSVITGWVETPTGPWRPAAWVNGTTVLLTNYSDLTLEGAGEGRAVSRDGNTIVGFSRDPVSDQRAAAMWTRTGGVFGPTQILGWIDGSEPGGQGYSICSGVSNDGSIAVGYASYYGDPFDVAGFVWTQATGVIDVRQWLANQGVLVDPNFYIKGMGAITPDGTKLYGYGSMLTAPYTTRSFRITLPGLTGVEPIATAPRLELSAPSPNPSSATTRLELTLATASRAEVSVFDAAGRRVATLIEGDLEAGRRSVAWDGKDQNGHRVPAGLYFARLSTTEGTTSQRIVRVD